MCRGYVIDAEHEALDNLRQLLELRHSIRIRRLKGGDGVAHIVSFDCPEAGVSTHAPHETLEGALESSLCHAMEIAAVASEPNLLERERAIDSQHEVCHCGHHLRFHGWGPCGWFGGQGGPGCDCKAFRRRGG